MAIVFRCARYPSGFPGSRDSCCGRPPPRISHMEKWRTGIRKVVPQARYPVRKRSDSWVNTACSRTMSCTAPICLATFLSIPNDCRWTPRSDVSSECAGLAHVKASQRALGLHAGHDERSMPPHIGKQLTKCSILVDQGPRTTKPRSPVLTLCLPSTSLPDRRILRRRPCLGYGPIRLRQEFKINSARMQERRGE